MTVNLTDLGSEPQGQVLLNYLESKGLRVNLAPRELYTQWSNEFMQQVQKELADYNQRQQSQVNLKTWLDSSADAEDQDVKNTETAFRVMAQRLRSYYGREDQDDEVPFW